MDCLVLVRVWRFIATMRLREVHSLKSDRLLSCTDVRALDSDSFDRWWVLSFSLFHVVQVEMVLSLCFFFWFFRWFVVLVVCSVSYSVCSLVRQISCWVWRWWSFFTVASCLFSKLFHLSEIHHLKSDFGLCYALLRPLLWIKAELTIFRVLTRGFSFIP